VLAEPPDRELISRLADAAGVKVQFAADPSVAHEFDLVLSPGPEVNQISEDLFRQACTAARGQLLFEHRGSLSDARQLIESAGLVWRGIAGYSPRLGALIVAAHPDHLPHSDWLRIKQS
jgi:hypothetical protein